MPKKLRGRAAVFFVALLLAAAPAAFAHELFGRSDEAVTVLARLYASACHVFPLTTFPASRRELAEAADALAEENPALADAVQDYEGRFLSGERGVASVEGTVAADISYRLETESFSFDPAGTPFYRSLDAVRLFRYADPLLSGGAKLSMGDKAELSVRADIMRRVNDAPYSPSNWISGDAGTPVAIENNFVQEGYLWYDFEPLSLLFGRASAHFGPMRDSLMVSDRIPYLDQLRLDLPLGPAKLNMLVASLETRASNQEQAEIAAAYSGTDFDLISHNIVEATSFLAIHRFEWDFPRVRLGIAGQCIVSRANNSYTLGDFFPVFSWHQGDLTPNNMCLLFDADVALFRDARLMAQFGVDDINAGDFGIGIGDDSIPTIPAGILALEYSPEIDGLQTDFYLEGGATHYLWGNFNLSGYTAGNTDVYSYLARSIYRWRLYVDGDSVDMPLSSPYGPGAIWCQLEASTGELLGCLRPTLSVLWLSLNDEANLVTTKYAADSSVANASRTNTLAIGLGADFSCFKYFTASVSPILFFQGGKIYGEATLSLRVGTEFAGVRTKK
jgi:hypothetical protein